MKVVGYVFLCQLALGLSLDTRAVEKVEIDCPDIFQPDCTDLLECNLPKDQYGCETGKYCIPKTIKLSDVQTCENSCPVDDCGPNEHYCKGGQDTATGCPLEDYCLPVLAPNGKPQTCDEPCEMGEVKCDQLYDKDGTPIPRTCQDTPDACPTTADDGIKYDEYGCVVHDAPNCPSNTADDKICDSNFCSEFCREKDTCSQVLTGFESCPKVCESGGCQIYETECPRTYNELGCPKDPECASHPSQCAKSLFEALTGCPVFEEPECDEETELMCGSPKATITELYAKHSLGAVPADVNAGQVCEDSKVCVAKFSKSGRNEKCEISTCPPVDCPAGEQLCEMGFEKSTGCELPPQCLNTCPAPDAAKYDNRGCQIFAEVECNEAEEKTCEGIINANGCKEMDTCLPKDDRCKCPVNLHNEDGCKLELTKENEPEDLVCGDNMHKCFMGFSEETKCPVGYECIRKVPEGKDQCVQECPPECDINTLRSCPNKEDQHGCPMPNSCEARTYENARDSTLKGSITCEKFCDPICDNPCAPTFDENGCKEPINCAEPADCPKSSYDENGCQQFEDECAPGEQSCAGGFDEDNCPKKPVCISSEKTCPPVCKSNEKLCSLGTALFPHLDDPIDLGQVCVERTIPGGVYSNEQCENPCPPGCEWYSERAVSAGYDKNTGCKLQEKCIAKETAYHDTLDAIATCSFQE